MNQIENKASSPKENTAMDFLNLRFRELLDTLQSLDSRVYGIGLRLSQDHPTETDMLVTDAPAPLPPFNDGVLMNYHESLNEMSRRLIDMGNTINKISALV